jgi:hypothetical protein
MRDSRSLVRSGLPAADAQRFVQMMSCGAKGQQIGAYQLDQTTQPRTPRKTEGHKRASG